MIPGKKGSLAEIAQSKTQKKAHTSCVQNYAVRESIREIYDVVMRYLILICRMDPSPHSPGKPGAEAPRLKAPRFYKHPPKTRQLCFILHASGTRPVRIRAPRPIGTIGRFRARAAGRMLPTRMQEAKISPRTAEASARS